MSSRTPGSNHGGNHDKGGRKLKSEVLVDWLTFSVKNATEPKAVIGSIWGWSRSCSRTRAAACRDMIRCSASME